MLQFMVPLIKAKEREFVYEWLFCMDVNLFLPLAILNPESKLLSGEKKKKKKKKQLVTFPFCLSLPGSIWTHTVGHALLHP